MLVQSLNNHEQDRQSNIEAHSCSHSCNGRSVSITYSKSAFVAQGIEHALHVHHIVICDLPGPMVIFTH